MTWTLPDTVTANIEKSENKMSSKLDIKKKLKNSKIHCVKVVLPKKYHIKIAPMTRRIVNGRIFLYKNLELTMDYFVQEKKRNSGLRLITRSPT